MRRKGAFISLFAWGKGTGKESQEMLKSEVARPSEEQGGGVRTTAHVWKQEIGFIITGKPVFVKLLGGDAAFLVPEELRLA